MDEEKPKSPAYLQRENHAESFLGGARKPLQAERKRLIELIVLAEDLPFDKIKPEEKEEILNRLWVQRRDIEAKLKLC